MRLCRLLEHWRRQKEGATPGFPWLRAILPLSGHLGTTEQSILRGHQHQVWSVAFSPAGDQIVSAGYDQMVRVWDVRTSAELAVLHGHEQPAASVAFSPEGDRVVSGSNDGTVRLWDARSGVELGVLRGHERGVRSAAFSPSGDRIVSGSIDGTLRVWDSRNGAELAVLRGHKEGVKCVAYSYDGTRLVSGGFGELGRSQDYMNIRVWDAESGACLAVLRGHRQGVLNVAFSPDGARIVSAADREKFVTPTSYYKRDYTMDVWDAHNGECIEVVRGRGDVMSIATGPPAQPYHALSHEVETVVEDATSRQTVAWLEPVFNKLVAQPNGCVWAGHPHSGFGCFTIISLGGDLSPEST